MIFCQDGNGFICSILGDQPAGGFGEKPNSSGDNYGGDQLTPNRDPESNAGGNAGTTIDYPPCYNGPNIPMYNATVSDLYIHERREDETYHVQLYNPVMVPRQLGWASSLT